MTKEELDKVLAAHKEWVDGKGGQRVDLRGADLRGAFLRDMDLRDVDLRGAAHAWAQVAFNGHGECGRMLTAVIYGEGQEAVYKCGCFYGSADELLKYISDGEEKLKASRMLAFETAAKLLDQ